MEKKFVGVREISVDDLVKPSGPYSEYRVRGVSSERVDELSAVLRTQGSTELSSELECFDLICRWWEEKIYHTGWKP